MPLLVGFAISCREIFARCRGLKARLNAHGGGGGGIRTHEGLAPPPVFKTGAFNHSATPPNNPRCPNNRCPNNRCMPVFCTPLPQLFLFVDKPVAILVALTLKH